jgi:phosphohistidine phosphatase
MLPYEHRMNGFLLLRHARALWPLPGQKDFDRSLAESGRKEALQLGATMRETGLFPDMVLCSPARRAAETWEVLGYTFPNVPVSFEKSLYEGGANAYLALIHASNNSHNLLIIGHNPMLEDLALALSINHENGTREHLQTGFPACGLAVFDVNGDLGSANAETTRLSKFIVPQIA